MNTELLELLPYIHKGYNCAQLLLLLAMQAAGEEDEQMLAVVRGLGYGIGQSGGPCGLLGGGAIALTWLAGGTADDPYPLLDALLNDYATWFMERTRECGTGCNEIVGYLSAAKPASGLQAHEVCGALLWECWTKILELAESYELERLKN